MNSIGSFKVNSDKLLIKFVYLFLVIFVFSYSSSSRAEEIVNLYEKYAECTLSLDDTTYSGNSGKTNFLTRSINGNTLFTYYTNEKCEVSKIGGNNCPNSQSVVNGIAGDCYSSDHICNTYGEKSTKIYKLDASKLDGGTNGKYFYLFKKNIIQIADDEEEEKGKVYNCVLKKYSCDYKIEEEATVEEYQAGYRNIIRFKDNKNGDFKKIIYGNLGSTYSFYQYVGKCNYNSCGDDILKSAYYFKFIDSSNKVFYYIKNVSNITCNGYLPACSEIEQNSRNPLYNSNTIKGRSEFYSTKILNTAINEENLQLLINNPTNVNCLDGSNEEKSYCSDYVYKVENDNLKKVAKYSNIERNENNTYKNVVVPSCFYKSCIDLSQDDINLNKSKDTKYCSEFKWLKNGIGLKYFPKEFPVYCSDINANGLKFKDGINKKQDNCYLKRCVALNANERKFVSKANMDNVSDKIINYNENNKLEEITIDNVKNDLPKYCENEIFFINGNVNNFDDLKLNVLRCNDFTAKSNITSINFENLFFESYNINNSKNLCRTDIKPIINNNYKNSSDKRNMSFLCNVLVTKNETNNNNNYSNSEIIKFPTECGVYGKIDIKKVVRNSGTSYSNIVKDVDNILAFINADIYYEVEKDEEIEYKENENDEETKKVTLKQGQLLLNKDNINALYSEANSILNRNSDYCDALKGFNECVNNIKIDKGLTDKEYEEKYDEEYNNCLNKKHGDNTYRELMELCDNISISRYFVNPKNYTIISSGLSSIGSVVANNKSYFDCVAYKNLLLDKNVLDGIMNSIDTSKGKSNSELINEILDVCDDNYFSEEDDRDFIVEANEESLKYSPMPIENLNFNNSAVSVGRNASAIGCYKANSGHNEKFCKIIDNKSLYINEFSTNYNEIKAPFEAKLDVSTCLRHSNDPLGDGNTFCGQREGGLYKDECIKLNVNYIKKLDSDNKKVLAYEEDYEQKVAEKEEDSNIGLRRFIHYADNYKYYRKNYSNDLNSIFFRTDRYGRNVYTFYDFLTNYNCSSTNGEHTDAVAVSIITAECTIAATIAASAIGVLIPFFIVFPIFLGTCTGLRIPNEAIFTFSNDLYYMKDYYESSEGKGFYSNFNITDNNNSLYNYYRRSDNLIEDLKYKFEGKEYSCSENGYCYYSDKNVLAKEIIKTCGLSDLIEKTKKDDNYSYAINKDLNGSYSNPEESLTDEQKDCLKGYGVHFFSHAQRLDEINKLSFLKEYKDGTYIKAMYGSKEDYGIIAVNMAKYAINNIKPESNVDCKLDEYGNPVGDLTYCRGYYYNDDNGKKVFVKEDQAVKVGLQTSPQLFFNLANPLNTPDLFNPYIFLTEYYSYSDNSKLVSYDGNEFELDFFDPKMVFTIDFPGSKGNLSNSVSNTYCNSSTSLISDCKSVLAEIENNKDKSDIYRLAYLPESNKNNKILTQYYYFVLTKSSKLDGSNVETPKVCLQVLSKVDSGIFDENSCYINENGNCWIIKERDVYCYDRRYPSISDIHMKPIEGFNYKNSYINVSAGGDFKDSSCGYTKINSESDYNLEFSSENKTQKSTLKFTRSDCSLIEIEYYQYQYELNKQLKAINIDDKEVNRLRTKIYNIEKFYMNDCDLQNGNPYYVINVNDKGEVDGKYKVQKNISAYGGFNEACLSKQYVEKIKDNISNTKVLAYKDNDNGVETKCVLNESSRRNSSCLIANKVYAVCDDSNSSSCNKTMISSLDGLQVKVREIDCENLSKNPKKLSDMSREDIEDMKLCYKGAYNPYGNIYNIDGNVDYSCSCELYDKNLKESIENFSSYFDSREITSRELGLCVDLINSPKCEAVKYYGSDRIYSDDLLIVKQVEFDKNNLCYPNMSCISDVDRINQNLWRTEEKLFGVIKPSTKSLGHAEFESTLYCADDEDLCIDSVNVKGQCNGYWKSSGSLPIAKCIKNSKGEYEYQLVEGSSECKRYSCPNVFGIINDEGKFNPLNDEKEIINATYIEGFDNSENIDFSKIEKSDYREYEHAYETDSLTVDKRGLKHGFATWEGVESSDVVKLQKASSCLTGYAPAGSNYYLKNNKVFNNNDTVNYENILKDDETKKGFVNLQESQVTAFNSVLEQLKNNLPQRYCDQKGNWLNTRDIYGNLDSEITLFHSKNNNWIKDIFKTSDGYLPINIMKDFKKTSDGVYNKNGNDEYEEGYISSTDKYKYCERLFCNDLSVPDIDYDIYNKEYNHAQGIGVTYGKTWTYMGGAKWDNISAPRNDSSKIENSSDSLDRNNISKYVDKIFSENLNSSVDTDIKYLKKVYGTCQNEYGYYNRNTKFIASTFDTQVSKIDFKDSDSVDPRKTSMIDESISTEKPMRTCNSVGVWSGVIDNCFRACEMLDMYHVNIENVKIGNEATSDTVVKHTDIGRISKTANYSKFDGYKQTKDSTNGYFYGDYVTGGAKWARTVVDLNGSKFDSQKGLRYVEVEGVCDTSYKDKNKTENTQYVVNPSGNKPKRKCYEDGTWGAVESNTRCVVFDTCRDLILTAGDMANIMSIYNDDEKTAKDISIKLNEISLNNDITNLSGDSILGKASVENTNVMSNAQVNISFTGYLENSYDNIYNNKLICNMSTGNSDYVDDWNITYRDIGLYFVPKTCDNSTYTMNNIVNRLEKNNIENDDKLYVKESRLNKVYDELKGGATKNFNGTNYPDETEKDVTIGSKKYKSYQGATKCNSNYFYNGLAGTAKENENYDVVYECTMNGGSDTQIKFVKAQTIDKDKGEIITPYDCTVKTCGGSGHNNWSKSVIYEVAENYSDYGYDFNNESIKNKHSTLSCLDGYAFIIENHGDYANKTTKDGSKFINYYSNGNDGLSEFYKDKGAVKSINVDCNVGSYNGNNDNYAYKYGYLDDTNLKKLKFCKDINKTNCKIKDLNEIYSDSFTRDADNGGYCVYMGCKLNENNLLKLENDINANNGFYNGVSGLKDKYLFNDIIGIGNSEDKNDRCNGRNCSIYKNLCKEGYDQYTKSGNETVVDFKDFYYTDYYYDNNLDGTYNICKDYMDYNNNDGIVEKDLYLKLDSFKKDLESMENIRFTSNSLSNDEEKEIKKEVVEYTINNSEDLKSYIKTEVKKKITIKDDDIIEKIKSFDTVDFVTVYNYEEFEGIENNEYSYNSEEHIIIPEENEVKDEDYGTIYTDKNNNKYIVFNDNITTKLVENGIINGTCDDKTFIKNTNNSNSNTFTNPNDITDNSGTEDTGNSGNSETEEKIITYETYKCLGYAMKYSDFNNDVYETILNEKYESVLNNIRELNLDDKIITDFDGLKIYYEELDCKDFVGSDNGNCSYDDYYNYRKDIILMNKFLNDNNNKELYSRFIENMNNYDKILDNKSKNYVPYFGDFKINLNNNNKLYICYLNSCLITDFSNNNKQLLKENCGDEYCTKQYEYDENKQKYIYDGSEFSCNNTGISEVQQDICDIENRKEAYKEENKNYLNDIKTMAIAIYNKFYEHINYSNCDNNSRIGLCYIYNINKIPSIYKNVYDNCININDNNIVQKYNDYVQSVNYANSGNSTKYEDGFYALFKCSNIDGKFELITNTSCKQGCQAITNQSIEIDSCSSCGAQKKAGYTIDIPYTRYGEKTGIKGQSKGYKNIKNRKICTDDTGFVMTGATCSTSKYYSGKFISFSYGILFDILTVEESNFFDSDFSDAFKKSEKCKYIEPIHTEKNGYYGYSLCCDN